MVYTASFDISLGASQTGLTLEAQLKDTAGVNVGSAITSGFVEIGVGNYMFTGTAIPDGHRGGAVFQVSPGGAIKAFAAINPEELENVDTKLGTDTIAELPQATPPANPTINQAIMLLYMSLRNKLTTDASTLKVFNDGGTVISKSALSDNGVIFTRDEMVSGP